MSDINDTLSNDIENLRIMLQSGGWQVIQQLISDEAKIVLDQLLEADEGSDSARLKERVNALRWVLRLPHTAIAEYDSNEVRAREDNPEADNPCERLSPIPEEGSAVDR